MAKMVTTYLYAVLLVSLGFFGVGALASATGPQDQQQTPAVTLQEHAEAGWTANSRALKTRTGVSPAAFGVVDIDDLPGAPQSSL